MRKSRSTKALSPVHAARSVGMSKLIVRKSPGDQTSSALSVSWLGLGLGLELGLGLRLGLGLGLGLRLGLGLGLG